MAYSDGRMVKTPQPSTSTRSAIADGNCVSLTRVTGHIPRAVAEMFTPRPDHFLTVEGDSMDRLGLTTGTLVAIKGDTDPRNGDVVVARIEDEVTLKRFRRKSRREVELCPESTNQVHRPMTIDLKTTEFHVDGVYVGALIGGVQTNG